VERRDWDDEPGDNDVPADDRYRAVAFSPNGKFVAAGGNTNGDRSGWRNGIVCIWNVKTGRCEASRISGRSSPDDQEEYEVRNCFFDRTGKSYVRM